MSLTLSVFILCNASRADEESSLPLPQLTEEDRLALQARGTLPGFGILLNPDLAEQEKAPLTQADSPESHQPSSDLSRFLPQSLMAPSKSNKSKAPSVSLVRIMRDVSADYLAQVKSAPPEMLLIDPNGELHETAHEEYQHFLEFHARDSRITLHVLLMGKNEQLPPDLSLTTLTASSASNGHSCWAIVPMGDVARVRLFLSPDVMDAARGIDLSELVKETIKYASSASETSEQLHRLLVRLSVRLFWLERQLSNASTVSETVLPAIPVKQAPTPLMEVAVKKEAWWTWPRLLMITGLLSILGFIVHRRWQKHKYRTHEWTLPEQQETVQRFGGTYCGGAAGVAW